MPVMEAGIIASAIDRYTEMQYCRMMVDIGIKQAEMCVERKEGLDKLMLLAETVAARLREAKRNG